MSEYGKYKVVCRYEGETVNADFWAHYASFGLCWVKFYKRNYKLLSFDVEIARFRRSSVIVISKETK